MEIKLAETCFTSIQRYYFLDYLLLVNNMRNVVKNLFTR